LSVRPRQPPGIRSQPGRRPCCFLAPSTGTGHRVHKGLGRPTPARTPRRIPARPTTRPRQRVAPVPPHRHLPHGARPRCPGARCRRPRDGGAVQRLRRGRTVDARALVLQRRGHRAHLLPPHDLPRCSQGPPGRHHEPALHEGRRAGRTGRAREGDRRRCHPQGKETVLGRPEQPLPPRDEGARRWRRGRGWPLPPAPLPQALCGAQFASNASRRDDALSLSELHCVAHSISRSSLPTCPCAFAPGPGTPPHPSGPPLWTTPLDHPSGPPLWTTPLDHRPAKTL